MKQRYITVYMLFVFLLCSIISFSQEIKFPYTSTKTHRDFYFGEVVEDNFIWLENVNNQEVKDWVKTQNNFTSKFFRNTIKKDLQSEIELNAYVNL